MVVLPRKTWLSGLRERLGGGGNFDHDPFGLEGNQTLGILAFEAARTMSRLVSLHRSLSDAEISKLRSDTMRSDGVAYLNSVDQTFLLRLACAEMVDELDRAAAAISRLGGRCRMAWPREFHHVYADLKSGSGGLDRGLGLGFQPKEVEKKVRKMEKYAAATSNLHAEMETLAEMEASERKLERWKNYSGPMTAATQPPTIPPGADEFQKKLAWQRRAVRRIQEESLWGQRYEKVTELMARATVTIFSRICAVFAPNISDLPVVVSDRDGRFRFRRNNPHLRVYYNSSSGPLERPMMGKPVIRNSGPILQPPTKAESKPWTTKALQASPTTVGGYGLALRYADVIDLAEKMLFSPETVGEDAREELYQMLPGGLRAAVRTKLRSCRRMDSVGVDATMAGGWRDAARRILEWLGPMAQDTIRWHSERSCERQRFEPAAPRVLMMHTLYFSDREKTEAAIVEVLVSLSFVCRCQKGCGSDSDGEGGGEGWD